jgi:hypothetical protein
MKSNEEGSIDLRGSSSNKNVGSPDPTRDADAVEEEEEEVLKSGKAAGGKSWGGVVKRL